MFSLSNAFPLAVFDFQVVNSNWLLDISNSQPPAALEANLDIDQLQDPEEFFSAFEKLESKEFSFPSYMKVTFIPGYSPILINLICLLAASHFFPPALLVSFILLSSFHGFMIFILQMPKKKYKSRRVSLHLM